MQSIVWKSSNLKYETILVCTVNGSIYEFVKDKKIHCRYSAQAYYRKFPYKFEPENIDPNLCSYLGFGTFGIEDTGAIKIDHYFMDQQLGLIKNTIALKQKNPALKVLAVVRGSFDEFDIQKRQNFIDTSVHFMEQNGFDGLDLNFLYPREVNLGDHRNVYETLLQELHVALSVRNLEFGITVSGLVEYPRAFVPHISAYVIFINIMAYGYGSESVLDYDAPLQSSNGMVGGADGIFDVESCISYWLKLGAPAYKLNLGLSIRGMAYLTYVTPKELRKPGKLVKVLLYNEICAIRKNFEEAFDSVQGVPYMRNVTHWISYENAQSLDLKLNLVTQYDLNGIMIRDIGDDDFHGVCGERYHLLQFARRKILGKYETINGISCPKGKTFENRCYREF
ncbi:acidic mammalian chitinase isoform X1 [Stomoxys calcitrans]|uniref:acidic mammalian chitinase isoform X1 n=1 Tax=Stomoxys calcitrans TaxID=35570 RepID=UPI0027E3A8CF|nr:acidic mammalian chitinase isoform X1 [Stomoxys calcitrans]